MGVRHHGNLGHEKNDSALICEESGKEEIPEKENSTGIGQMWGGRVRDGKQCECTRMCTHVSLRVCGVGGIKQSRYWLC